MYTFIDRKYEIFVDKVSVILEELRFSPSFP